MTALEAIRTRRSTRKFQDKPVERELLNTIVEAGRMAPSGGNNQTTHIIVITNRDILNELAALVKLQFSKMEVTPGMYPSMAGAIRNSKKERYVFTYDAPVLIVTANKKEYGNNMADSVCALENMMIAANELDLGTCYINQLKWLSEDPEIVQYMNALGLAEDEIICASLSVGYADTEDGLPNRTPLPRTGNPVTWI